MTIIGKVGDGANEEPDNRYAALEAQVRDLQDKLAAADGYIETQAEASRLLTKGNLALREQCEQAEAALREATGCLERIAKWRIGDQSPAVIAQGFLDRREDLPTGQAEATNV